MNENDWEDFKESVIPIQKNKIVNIHFIPLAIF